MSIEMKYRKYENQNQQDQTTTDRLKKYERLSNGMIDLPSMGH